MKIVTHSGKFHADDVFAVATLLLVYPNSEVVRSRDDELIASADIVVDVGQIHDPSRMRFDHHQADGAGVRANGIPYASFGLVWKEYGGKLADIDEVRMIEEKLVMPIDALDNGVSITKPVFENVKEYGISDYLYSFWIDSDVSEGQILEIFNNAVSLAKDLIQREIQKARRIVTETKFVEKIYDESPDKRVIILDRHYAWGRILVEKEEPLIVIFPGLNNEWISQAVRKELGSFKTRIYFPKPWGGKRDQELVEVTGVDGAVFVHKDLFMAVAKTKEGALALAQKALNA